MSWSTRTALKPRTVASFAPVWGGPSRSRGASSVRSSSLTPAAGPSGFGHDFGKVRVLARDAGTVNDQTSEKSGDEAGASKPASAPGPAAPAATESPKETSAHDPKAPVIDAVELVSSSSGAVGGFPQDRNMPTASLNSPGPFNDTWITGAVANIQQVHFHLARGWPADVRAKRIKNRTAVRYGKTYPESGDDGPPLFEYQFTKDKMVIADAPGWFSQRDMDEFPISYKSDFSVYAFDPLTYRILASISYRVEIEKTHYTQHDPVNKVEVTDTKIGRGVPSPVKDTQKPKT